jgi:hypothetical protein
VKIARRHLLKLGAFASAAGLVSRPIFSAATALAAAGKPQKVVPGRETGITWQRS